MKRWKIAIDTGGTFTDCLALDPQGKKHSIKVLSTGCLRGTVDSRIDTYTLRIDLKIDLKKDILRAYTFRILNSPDATWKVRAYNPREGTLLLDQAADKIVPGDEFEIFSGEEAPLLASRILTACALDQDLPPLDMCLGTTRGTNALLEHKGIPPLLITTRGFADLAIIGDQQRPDLFSLNIEKSKPLFAKVIEVDERIGANGEILRAPSESHINTILKQVFRSKAKVIVVAFVNSYCNAIHEKIFVNLLRTAGYKYVSGSHEAEQAIGFFPRLQTALVNGYLQPVLEDYLGNIAAKLPAASSLKIMTSSGSLVSRNDFYPKDGLLSGPAGGVAGAAAIGRNLGIDRILAFDMGGTSTDVSRFSGDFDYVYETRVGDQRILAPALHIETVAAGGGSICSFDGFRLTVGPESAGAEPGPACYANGGPLTITDVDLLLGRMNASRFSIPVDISHANHRLQELKEQHTALQSLNDWEILSGFLDIANEKMARAIEKISVRRGFEPGEYSLLAFGGAGGMHACSIAGILDIGRIVVPCDAGILSAFGIAHAKVEKMINRQVLKPLKEVEPELGQLLREMSEEAIGSLEKTGIGKNGIRISRIILLTRFAGQDTTLELNYHQNKSIETSFRKEYKKRYGHYIAGKEIEIESIRLIACAKSGSIRKPKINAKKYVPGVITRQKALIEGKWADIPVYMIDEIGEGTSFEGPAIVLSDTGTSFIDIMWHGTVNSDRDLLLEKIESHDRTVSVQQRSEQVQLELFTNRFRSVVEDMGALLQRTSFSVNIKERLDFSCALLDPGGFLVVNAPHIPVHLGALGLCTRKLMEALTPREGDIVATNHPAFGGSHLPDVTLTAPVFYEKKLIAWVANRAHHAELGGISPGSMPADAKTMEEEGVVIPPVLIARDGKTSFRAIKRIFSEARYPTRALNENIADLDAAVASIRKGILLVQELCRNYGADNVAHNMKALNEYAGNLLKPGLVSLLEEPLHATEYLDDGSPLSVSVRRKNNRIIFDFTGSAPVHGGNMNATPAIVNSVVLYVLRLLVAEDLPLNEGLLTDIDLVLPPGLLNPGFSDDPSRCPAVVGGNVEVSQRLVDTILKAFGITACSQGTMNNLLFGNERFGFYETVCGGVGAGNGFHGASAVHQHMTNTKITDVEVMEKRFPVRVNKFTVRYNSGGKGRWSGGDGVERRITFLQPVRLTILSQHRKEQPYGMKGGGAGKCGEQHLTNSRGEIILLGGISSVSVNSGDELTVLTPGGGGWG